MRPAVLKRYWESTKNGNYWYYMAVVKHDYSEKLMERQLGAVSRVHDTRSPNFNKWVTTIVFEDNQMFSKKSDAMAYVVAMVALR